MTVRSTNKGQRIAQERDAEALLAANWQYTDVVNQLMERHDIGERTAKRRITAVYEKLETKDQKERRRAHALGKERVRRELQRLRTEIARLDQEEARVAGGGNGRPLHLITRVRERISRTMLGWEKYYLELQGVSKANVFALYDEVNDEADLPLNRDDALAELATGLTDDEFQTMVAIRTGKGGDG